jgi:geranylgeranyl pyrophosphate synthase
MSAARDALAVEGMSEYVAAVEERLDAAVGRRGGLVGDAAAGTLRAGGKRLRPMLVYLSAAPRDRGRPGLAMAGCAVELVHMATLVHDDVLDAAPLRRGRPTVWREHGQTVACATGDYLFARAFAELTETDDMQAVSLLAEACLALARGEILQRAQAGDPTTTPDSYLERCALKTGRLFAAAAMLGGRLGGLPQPDVGLLGEFGVALGLAFQVADDILDCDGQPDTTGKPLGTDLLDGTVTLPLLLAARRDPRVAEVIGRGAGPADVLPTLARVARCGAVRDARLEAQGQARTALDILDRLDGRADVESLRSVVRGVVDRRS